MKKQLEKITIADFEFPAIVRGKPARKVSKHAKNLIRAILTPNPTKRPSIDAILRSKWITDASDSTSDDDFDEFSLGEKEFTLKNVKDHSSKQEFIPTKLMIAHSQLTNSNPNPKGLKLTTNHAMRES